MFKPFEFPTSTSCGPFCRATMPGTSPAYPEDALNAFAGRISFLAEPGFCGALCVGGPSHSPLRRRLSSGNPRNRICRRVAKNTRVEMHCLPSWRWAGCRSGLVDFDRSLPSGNFVRTGWGERNETCIKRLLSFKYHETPGVTWDAKRLTDFKQTDRGFFAFLSFGDVRNHSLVIHHLNSDLRSSPDDLKKTTAHVFAL
jgi:hypothetical protein